MTYRELLVKLLDHNVDLDQDITIEIDGEYLFGVLDDGHVVLRAVNSPVIRYSLNNSGGTTRWFNVVHWNALKEAGWKIEAPGYEGMIWEATRTGLSYEDAVAEWERVTGLSSKEEGCPCCGPPHTFSEEY